MKRIALLCMAVIFLLTGCAGYNTRGIDRTNSDGRLTVLYNDGFCLIYRDNETGVQYISVSSHGVCVMVDKDGNPYIQEDGDGI